METNQIPNPPQSSSSNTGMAIFAYLGPLILVPFLTDAKNDPFVKFHLKQGLVLIIVSIGWGILRSFMPDFYWTFGTFRLINWILSLVSLGFLIIAIIGIMNAVNGRMKDLPLIGSFAKHFNF